MAESAKSRTELIKEMRALRSRIAEMEELETTLGEVQEDLRAARAVHREFLAVESDAVLTFDAETLLIEDVNEAAIQLYGYDRPEFLRLKATDLAEDPEAAVEYLDHVRRGDGHTVACLHHKKRDGSVFLAEISTAVLSLRGHSLFCDVLRDVTDRQWAREELRRIRAAVDGASDAILIIDMNGRAIYMNPAFQTLFRHTLGSLNAVGIESLCADDATAVQILEATQDKRGWTGEVRMKDRDGRLFPALVRGTPVLNEQDELMDVLIICSDITERHRVEKQLLYEATHDALTGIFNRRHLMEELARAVKTAQRYSYPLCLCLCDVDGFKTVNDTYGHGIGDEVLARFGRLIRSEVRSPDVPARYGGDEFCIVLPHVDLEGARIPIERLRARFEKEVFRADDGAAFSVTATFGIARLAQPAVSDKELLACADRALYQAKAEGRNRIVIRATC